MSFDGLSHKLAYSFLNVKPNATSTNNSGFESLIESICVHPKLNEFLSIVIFHI